MDRQQIINTLTSEFGGNLWENYGKARIYFDGATIASRQGLDWANYRSGNVSSATLNGERISNSECKRILEGFAWHKIWYDLDDGQFHTRSQGYQQEIQYPASREMYEAFTADALVAIA